MSVIKIWIFFPSSHPGKSELWKAKYYIIYVHEKSVKHSSPRSSVISWQRPGAKVRATMKLFFVSYLHCFWWSCLLIEKTFDLTFSCSKKPVIVMFCLPVFKIQMCKLILNTQMSKFNLAEMRKQKLLPFKDKNNIQESMRADLFYL